MIEEITEIKEIVKANATAVYQDAAQPSVRVVGKSLAQCLSLFSTPIGRTAEILESNVHRYIDKLEGLNENELVAPDTRVLVPVLEKMRFIDDEKVADYYAEILATASKKEHASKVMVTFIEILNRLCADELLILEFINSGKYIATFSPVTLEESKKMFANEGDSELSLQGNFPVIDVKVINKNNNGYRLAAKNFNVLAENIKLSTPNNIDSYLDNMISLGLVTRDFDKHYAFIKIYEHLENHKDIIKHKETLTKDEESEFTRAKIEITDLGKKLISLSSKEIEVPPETPQN